MPDKYSALWLSHSSIRDYQRCPKAYYLSNVYKDPKTQRKIQLVSSSLSLGSAVHQVLEHLADLPVVKRFDTPLQDLFEKVWRSYSGIKGGFNDQDTERQYKERGLQMLRRVTNHPGPLERKAVRVKEELPQYWFSEPEEMILCGKIDWLEYKEQSDEVHIIDFKTGKSVDESSLQLPIYLLLASNVQKRRVEGASYWYLETANEPTPQELPDPQQAYDAVMSIAKQIKLARKLNLFKCSKGEVGCSACRPLQKVIDGAATYVGAGEYGKDCYMLSQTIDQEVSIL